MALPFVMASCAYEGGPYPFPSGYTYHHQAFKSPGGPKVEMDESQLLAVAPAAQYTPYTPYRADNDDVTIDRSALDNVGVVRAQQQQAVFAPQFERVVE